MSTQWEGSVESAAAAGQTSFYEALARQLQVAQVRAGL